MNNTLGNSDRSQKSSRQHNESEPKPPGPRGAEQRGGLLVKPSPFNQRVADDLTAWVMLQKGKHRQMPNRTSRARAFCSLSHRVEVNAREGCAVSEKQNNFSAGA